MAKHQKNTKSDPRIKSFQWPDWSKYLLVVLVFMLYGKTMQYGFVLDDDLFVKNSPVVQSGFSGIPAAFYQESLHHFKGSNFQIYRPAMISCFAIEKALFGFNPQAFHFINLILYSLICLALYGLIRTLFPANDPRYAFFAALIFLVHPVHTEVVANIKSQDELLAALGCLLSLRYALRFLDSANTDLRMLFCALISYLLALFSKESSAVFYAVFPMTFLLLRKQSVLKAVKNSLPYLGVALFFILCRYFALRGVFQSYETTVIENILYGTKGLGEATATRASILLMFWLKLFWPVNLSWDYSFSQIPITGWNSASPFIAVGLFLLAIITALYFFKKKSIVTWGIAFFLLLIIPTSNLLFLNGTTFAERFLFLPSAGIVIAFIPLLSLLSGAISEEQTGRNENLVWLFILPVFLLSFYVASSRCSDWKDNFTLFESAARNTPNSSRVQAGMATEYMNKAEKSSTQQERLKFVGLAQQHFKKALEIFPKNADAAYKLGLIYAIMNDTSLAVSYYRIAIEHKPDFVYALTNLSAVYASKQQYDSALFFLNRSFTADSINPMTLTNLVVIHSIRGEDSLVVKYAQVADRNHQMSDKISVIYQESIRKIKGKGN